MQPQIILETERTILRQLCPDDQAALTAILGDINVMYAWEHAFTDDEIHDWIAENILRYTRDGYSYWAVICKNTERLIGVCGLLQESANDKNYLGIGYIFAKAFWHQGYAFECAAACKTYAFDRLHPPLLTAQISPGNSASRKVAAKLGMSELEQINRVYRGKTMPHILYGCRK